MKMLMVICPENRQGEIRTLIAKHDVHAYSEVRDIIGAGATGPHLDNRTWPGKSVLVFSVIPDEKKAELLAAIRDCAKTLFPSEGLRAFVLPVEEMV